MEVRRSQLAVGQGGFHVAEINADGLQFRYIYDCGSKNRKLGKQAIKDWKSYSNYRIDWLIVSSFDADHFNCISDLLDSGFEFKAIVLPHLLDVSLLKHILLYFVARGMAAAELNNIVKIFQRIFHGDFGIVLPTGRPLDPSPAPTLARQELISTETLVADSVHTISGAQYSIRQQNWVLRFYSVEMHQRGIIDQIFSIPELSALKILVETLAVSIHGLVDQAEIKRLLNEVGLELNRVPAQSPSLTAAVTVIVAPAAATTAAAQPTPVAVPTNNYGGMTIKKILGSACRTKGDKNLLDDYNSASLCLYSGPAYVTDPQPGLGFNFSILRTSVEPRRHRKLPSHTFGTVGWLGVGDITFKSPKSVQRFKQHYRCELPYAGTRMLAHHGAQSNYDPPLSNLATLGEDMPQGGLWVAAADPANGGYRHPDGAVVNEAILSGGFHLVSADVTTALHEHILVPGKM